MEDSQPWIVLVTEMDMSSTFVMEWYPLGLSPGAFFQQFSL